MNVCNVYIPSKNENKNKKDKPKWLTNELRVSLREKRSLWFYNNKTKWKDNIMKQKFKEIKIWIKKVSKKQLRHMSTI